MGFSSPPSTCEESALLEQELLDLVRRRIHDEHKDHGFPRVEG